MSPRSVLTNFWGSFYFDLLLDFISPFPAVPEEGSWCLFWCLVYQLHKLVELRSDDNLCAAVALLSSLCAVVCQWVVLATATSGEALRIYTVFVLQSLNHA